MSFADAPPVVAVLSRLTRLREVEAHERVGSTNDVALQRLLDGAAPGLVVVADRQTAGRGRAGRRWVDDLDGLRGPASLAVTAAVDLPARGVGLLPLVAGLAVADAFDAAGADSRLKWPNDVLLDGRKACGILVERHTIARTDVALVGCGLDLDWRGITRTGDAASWSSLAEALGRDVDRAAVLADLLQALDARLEQVEQRPDTLLAAYRSRCATLGQQVRVERPGGAVVVGVAVDLDHEGHLVVDAAGVRTVIHAGEVHRIPRAGS